MEHLKLQRHILCIDLKSFYASVECSLLGVDPFKTPLVVADPTRGGGSVVLAVTPYLKALGVPNRCRVKDLPVHLNIQIQRPRMKTYMRYAKDIIAIYLRYVSDEDMHVYSIDEVFLDLTNYLTLYQKTPLEIAKNILKNILDETHITATCGIGRNMLMAKLALDIDAKHDPDYIASWDYDDIPKKLWTLTRLSDMWGIGPRMERNLLRLGIKNVYDLAHSQPSLLKHHFGIIGEEMYYHAHGIDMSLIQDKTSLFTRQKSFGQSQVLFKDYNGKDFKIILRETVDEVARRLRHARMTAQTIALGVGFSKSYGGGFGKQFTLEHPTMHADVIFQVCEMIFDAEYQDEPIRRIHVSVTQLKKVSYTQLSLFDNQEQRDHKLTLEYTIDKIKNTHGKNSIHRALSELEGSTIKARNHMVGGHHE
jgi:DNA polymerase V